MKRFSLIFLLVYIVAISNAQHCITIDPSINYQTHKGWGVSLSWWAHDVGNSLPDDQLELACEWLTDPSELNMNVFRYNISGGDDPSHKHMREDAQVPGYKLSEHRSYDWSRDSSQRNILLKLNRMRPDAIYEAVNYSPPYWMTKSGCSSGHQEGLENLREDHYDDFAIYLLDCVEYYRNTYGITFSTISPVNEPYSNWWKAMGKQEGCAFGQASQERLIRELYGQMEQRNMLGYSAISVMDANSIDEGIEGVKQYKENGLLPLIGQINVHTYAGKRREELHDFASQNNIELWQSESGPLNIRKKGWENFLFMADRIILDMRELKPVVWCDWQYMGRGFDGVWSLVGYDLEEKTIQRTKGFYVRKQFTSLIRTGYSYIYSNHPNTLAAISPEKDSVVLVVTNNEQGNYFIQLNLKDYTITGEKIYRTSINENFDLIKDFASVHDCEKGYLNKEKSVTTFVLSVEQKDNNPSALDTEKHTGPRWTKHKTQ